MSEPDAVHLLAQTAHSTRTWILAAIGLVVIELAIPNGYALALALGAVTTSAMVWVAHDYTWASELTDPMHWLWPAGAWALTSTAVLYAIRRIAHPGPNAKRPDINVY